MLNENKIIAVRFSAKDAALIDNVSNKRGQNISDFIRLIVRKELARLSYLSTEEKKALEIKEVDNYQA